MMYFAINPFFLAYTQSDIFGKAIFWALLFLSVLSWIVLIIKVLQTRQLKRFSKDFHEDFQEHKFNPLGLNCEPYANQREVNAFFSIYLTLKKYTVEVLNKNRRFGKAQYEDEETISYLSPSDIDYVESHLMTTVALQIKKMERNLFILPTVVSVAPFLGLLGTVWGILITFTQMQSQTGGGMNQAMLGGISLALTTTVVGLLDAIPALIGYNYLKQVVRDFETDMGGFSNEALATVEMQYRKVDVK